MGREGFCNCMCVLYWCTSSSTLAMHMMPQNIAYPEMSGRKSEVINCAYSHRFAVLGHSDEQIFFMDIITSIKNGYY